MNAEEVASDFASQLASMQLSHLEEINAMQLNYDKEMERLESSHQKERSRLSDQELHLASEKYRYMEMARREKLKLERELEEMKDRHRREEARLREENNKMYQETIQQRVANGREIQNEVSRGLGAALCAQTAHYGQQEVRDFQNRIIKIENKWNEVKNSYQTCLLTEVENRASVDDISDSIKELKSFKKGFNKELEIAKGAMGRIRHLISVASFSRLDRQLNLLQRSNFEDVEIIQIEKAAKRGDPICWKELDSALDKCGKEVMVLLEIPLALQSTDNFKMLNL